MTAATGTRVTPLTTNSRLRLGQEESIGYSPTRFPARLGMTPAIFSLGGATLDCEWNHLQQKLMRGLGVVAIENQARI